MKQLLFLPLLFFISIPAFCQEEITLTDLKSCTRFYYSGNAVAKQIRHSHDTSTYFHDGELIIFFNQKKTGYLSENSFYIFNHGFNKLISMKVLMIEMEGINSRKDKKTVVSTPDSNLSVFYKDSLQRCGQFVAGPITVHILGYKETKIRGLLVEIIYYDQHIYKWFLHEPAEIEDPTNIIWKVIR